MTREQELVDALQQLLDQHAAGQPIELAEQIVMLLERQEMRVAGERKWRRWLMDIHGVRGVVAGFLIILGALRMSWRLSSASRRARSSDTCP